MIDLVNHRPSRFDSRFYSIFNLLLDSIFDLSCTKSELQGPNNIMTNNYFIFSQDIETAG